MRIEESHERLPGDLEGAMIITCLSSWAKFRLKLWL